MISVVIPVFNGEQFVGQAIESVLGQSSRPGEIIVIDDGSTDQTAAIVQSYEPLVRYAHQPNQGPAAARNRGLRMAEGELVAFLDADDLWPADKLHRQQNRLEQEPTAGLCLGQTQITLWNSQSATFEPWGQPRHLFIFGCALIRKVVFAQVGILAEDQPYAEDVDWFLRAQEQKIPILFEPAVVLFSRRHQHNMTNDQQTSYHYLALALKKALDRRRKK